MVYGQITQTGDLLLSSKLREGYKPVQYAEIPDFDQSTHYVKQTAPIVKEDHIYVGVEVKELENIDEGEGDEELTL